MRIRGGGIWSCGLPLTGDGRGESETYPLAIDVGLAQHVRLAQCQNLCIIELCLDSSVLR